MSKAYNKCEEDKKYGYNYTKACRKYFLNYYTLKQYDIDIKYDYVRYNTFVKFNEMIIINFPLLLTSYFF